MRGISRAIAAIGAAAPFLLAGCGAVGKLGSTHHPPATSFTVTAHVTTLVVKGGAGSITVTGGNRAAIAVSQQSSYTSTPPAATHVVSGTTLTLTYTCAAEFACGVSYDIQVPRGVAVRASGAAGAITLTSLAGPVSAQTTTGLISATGLDSSTASLKSTAGGIIATFTSVPASVRASTTFGPISISVPRLVSYHVELRTFLGSKTVTVPMSDESPHAISASSQVGSITISPY
jgi:hypothetical protein